MKTSRQSKILASGRLNDSTRPVPHTEAQVAKLVLYIEPSVILGVLEAIAAVTPEQLKGIAKGGNHNGRCLGIICRQWLRDKKVAAAVSDAMKGRAK